MDNEDRVSNNHSESYEILLTGTSLSLVPPKLRQQECISKKKKTVQKSSVFLKVKTQPLFLLSNNFSSDFVSLTALSALSSRTYLLQHWFFLNWTSHSFHSLCIFSKFLIPAWYKNNLCMHGWIHTRCTTSQSGIMTILNDGLPLSNTVMYNFRKRPGGSPGESLWFNSDRDITSTLGKGRRHVSCLCPIPSPSK